MILNSYPGPIRLLRNDFLDQLLGPLARPTVPVKAGSTVAHLSFYLAQLLGGDPIILIGQDLGFTDGLYYCPGTAIHRVWASELNAFNTLESMELRRILRHKNHLRSVEDVHGRTIYTDEQMATYLAQFERDFSGAPQRIVDATEGGVPKRHTERLSLANALDRFATDSLAAAPGVETGLDHDRLEATRAHLAHRLEQVHQLRRESAATLPLLRRMITSQENERAMERLFKELERHQKAVAELSEAFMLIDLVNPVGVFKRMRADRRIQAVEDDIDPIERQKRQLERDIENVDWIVQACDEAITIFEAAMNRLDEQCGAAQPAGVKTP